MQQQTAAGAANPAAAAGNNMMFPGAPGMGMPVMTPVLVQMPQAPGSTDPPMTQMMWFPMYPGMMPGATPATAVPSKKEEGKPSK